MRRQAQGQIVTWVSRSVAMAAATAMLFAAGCVRRQPQPGLLGSRSLVPAPFVEPPTSAPATALPPEPAFPGTTVIPGSPAPDEELIMQPVDEPDVKPAKSGTDKYLATPKPDGERLTYTVKKGDSLWLIGQMYGVSVAELTEENGIRQDNVLKVGQVLTLPAGARLRDISSIKRAAPRRAAAAPASKARPTTGTTKPAASASKPATPSGSTRKTLAKEPIPADGMYTIKSGDNPWDLARKFGVKHDDLMKWNNLKSDTVLQIGQKIRLRAGAAEAAAPATTLAPVPAAALGATTPAPGTVLPETTPLAPADTTVPAPAETPTVPATAPAGTPPAAADPGTVVPPAAAPGALDLPKKLSHSVTEGETLQIIAEMYGTTVEAIKKENPTIKTDADLQPNLKLMVPYR